MRQNAQKPGQKFCSRKTTKKRKTHPEKAKKGETGCVLGAGGDGNGWEWVKPDGKTRKARRKSRDGLVSAAASVGAGRSPQATSAPRHAPQESLRAHLVAKSYRTLTKKSGIAEAIPDFLAGAEGLSLAGRLGRFAAERHWRSLTPRHAVLEWMWESALGERGRGSVARFPTQVRGRTVLVWCYGKFSGPKRAKKSGKSPKKREILLTKTDTVPIL